MYKWKSNVINIKEKIYSAYELGMVEIHAGLNERPYLGKIYKILSSKITFLCSEEFYAQLYHRALCESNEKIQVQKTHYDQQTKNLECSLQIPTTALYTVQFINLFHPLCDDFIICKDTKVVSLTPAPLCQNYCENTFYQTQQL